MPDIKIKTIGDLKKLQKWMQASITMPRHQQTSRLKKQTAVYLTGNSRMSAKERFDIYVSDFWPRMIDSLSEDFPLFKKKVGQNKFVYWIEKYLEKYPSTSFTLFHAGAHFPEFIKKYYKGAHRQKVYETVCYEWAAVHAYIAPEAKTLNQKTNLSHLKITLHPSLSLVPYQNHFWAVYRFQNKIREQKIDRNFYKLLEYINKTHTLAKAIGCLSRDLTESQAQQILPQITNWFTIAQSQGWLVYKK